MRKLGNIVWGLILIALGTIFALNVLEITNINIFFDGWWTLLIIIPCFVGVLTDESKIGNLIGLVVGVILLLCARDIISFVMVVKLILPAVLIIIGFSIIFRETIRSKTSKKIKSIKSTSPKPMEYTASFSSEKVMYPNKNFEGAEVYAVFGGENVNLSQAVIEKDVVISTTSVFGHIDILVPENVNVEVKSTSIFGGISNKTPKTKGDDVHTIYVSGFCLFGGVEIKQ